MIYICGIFSRKKVFYINSVFRTIARKEPILLIFIKFYSLRDHKIKREFFEGAGFGGAGELPAEFFVFYKFL